MLNINFEERNSQTGENYFVFWRHRKLNTIYIGRQFFQLIELLRNLLE
jgi:hypothetical protein